MGRKIAGSVTNGADCGKARDRATADLDTSAAGGIHNHPAARGHVANRGRKSTCADVGRFAAVADRSSWPVVPCPIGERGLQTNVLEYLERGALALCSDGIAATAGDSACT